jgi:Holliday junction resolvase RusA-like endonuclease
MNLTIKMPWEKDLSVNHMRFGKGGHYRRKPHVQAWTQRLYWEIFDQLWECPDSANITITFRFPDKRRRDDHNYYKVICDAVAAGLGIDDKDIRISTKSVMVDRDNPGFRIEVSDASLDRGLSIDH